MNLPKIDLAALPDLDQITGLFGSLAPMAGPGHDDRIVILMVYIYELLPPESMI